MPLSLDKLELLLKTQGYIPHIYYSNKGMCMFVEVSVRNSGDKFLLYIPSKYDFEAKNRSNIYNVNYLDLDGDEDEDNVTDNYAKQIDQFELENKYNELNIDIDLKKETINKSLENKYNRPIKLKDISDDDMKYIKSIYRQLRRLRYCVQGLEYKISILYKNYLCVIRRDDTIDILTVSNFYKQSNTKKLFVVTDLEVLYEKPERLLLDVSTIKNGIYNILGKNQITHKNVIENLLKDKKNIDAIINKAQTDQIVFKQTTQELNKMLDTMNTNENRILEKIKTIQGDDQKYDKGIYQDTNKSFYISRYTKELSDISRIKKDVIDSLISTDSKQENLLLTIDGIMFDNCIMTDTIITNFKELKKIHSI